MDRELEELQNPDNWDNEQIEVREPVKNPRSVVSIAFQADDFRRVSRYAREHGMKISEFIRAAALEKTHRAASQVSISSSRSMTGLTSGDYTATISRVSRYETTLEPGGVTGRLS